MKPHSATHPILTWNDELALGVEAMDDEHKVWLRLVRNFQQALAAGEAASAVYAAIVDALIYTERHFANEEKLMREEGYPLLDEHREQHRRAAAGLHSFTAGAHDEQEIIDFIGNFLPNWLVQHIDTSDRRFAEWLQQKNGTRPRRAQSSA